MWPFTKKETRSTNYTSANLAALYHSVTGEANAGIKEGAAMQTAASLMGRCLSVASVAPGMYAQALSALTLYDIGRALVSEGEAVYLIEIVNGQVVLMRANAWEITGVTRDAWTYWLEFSTPSGNTRKRNYPAAQVFHARINTTSKKPWKGLGFADTALLSATILNLIEKTIRGEAKAGSGYILPVQSGVGPDEFAKIQTTLSNLKGGVSLVQLKGAFADPGKYNPKEFSTMRVGSNPPDVIRNLRNDLHNEILSLCGVPPDLFSSGPESREAFRFYLHATLNPILGIITQEAKEKLSQEIRFDLKALFASDIQGRARAFQSMVKGEMPIEKAAALSGLLIDG